MIKDSDALDQLVSVVIKLSTDVEKQHELKSNISKLGIINADEIIAKEILKLI